MEIDEQLRNMVKHELPNKWKSEQDTRGRQGARRLFFNRADLPGQKSSYIV